VFRSEVQLLPDCRILGPRCEPIQLNSIADPAHSVRGGNFKIYGSLGIFLALCKDHVRVSAQKALNPDYASSGEPRTTLMKLEPMRGVKDDRDSSHTSRQSPYYLGKRSMHMSR
jgi:hypothetical protein